MDVEDEDDF